MCCFLLLSTLAPNSYTLDVTDHQRLLPATTLRIVEADFILEEFPPVNFPCNTETTIGGKFLRWSDAQGWISNKMINKKIKTTNGNRGGGVKNTLKVIHWNAGGAWWESKISEIQALILETLPDLLFVSEANLRANTPTELTNIPGYYIIKPNTELTLGYSRILLLAREGVRLNIMNECMDTTIPSIWVKGIVKGRKPLIIGGIYREYHHLLVPTPNNTDDWALQVQRWKTTIQGWKRASRNSKCIILGDLNVDYLKWSDSSYRGKKLIQIMKDEIITIGYCQLIKKVTRFWPGVPSTLVDQIWTNSPESILQTTNNTRASSDHNWIAAIIRTKNRKIMVHDARRRNRSKFDIEEYRRKIKNIDWGDFYRSTDINIINDIFVRKVGTILEELAPLQNIQHRKNFSNWLTPKLKDQMLLRDTKREIARKTNNKNMWRDYKIERNNCTKNMKIARNEHIKTVYNDLEKSHDVKNIFNVTRKLLNWEGAGAPQSLLADGVLIRRPVDMANCQMKFFNKKVKRLISNLPAKKYNPLMWLNDSMTKWSGRIHLQKFSFSEISHLDTVKLIAALGNSTTFGTDLIDALAIKAAATDLALPLNHMINVSLNTSKFANRWKLAKLLPLLKSSELNRLHSSSYRPIAILPTISKLIEKAAQSQLMKFLENNELINENSHAYRKGYSTTTALLEITEELYRAVDNKKISNLMTLDQSSAFDCVHHGTLLQKLKVYNLEESAIEWIRSYLGHRTQFVEIGNASSEMFSADRGVPQGSVLGPLLYALYTNEMSTVIVDKDCNDPAHLKTDKLFGYQCQHCGNLTTYADDASYHIANKHRDQNQEKLVKNLDRLADFLTANELVINQDKTHLLEVMIKQKRGRMPPHPPPPNFKSLIKITPWKLSRTLNIVRYWD